MLLGVVFEIEIADFGGHAPFCYHGCSHAGYFVEIVACAGSDGGEVEFFADAATERHGHAIHELINVHQVDIALGKELGVAEGAFAAGDDGDFEKGVGVFEEPAADGMAGFVVGYCAPFFGIQYEGFAFKTADYTLDGLFEVGH